MKKKKDLDEIPKTVFKGRSVLCSEDWKKKLNKKHMECVMGSNPAWTSEGLTALLGIFQVLTSKNFSPEETERRTMGVKLQNIEPAKANLFNVICEKQWKKYTLYP